MCDSDEVLARCLCLYACDWDVSLRAWRNILECQTTVITFHAVFWSKCLVFATQSQAVRMSVISMRSTQHNCK